MTMEAIILMTVLTLQNKRIKNYSKTKYVEQNNKQKEK